MSLRFHWFLPTSGDGRAIIGRGHSLPLGKPGETLGSGERVTGAAVAASSSAARQGAAA